MDPISIPRRCSDIAPPAQAIGADAADFIVREVPLYEPSGEGTHRYVRVRKTGWNTRDVVRTLAAEAGVGERDVGYAGMKDRNAVTEQWLSFPEAATDPDTWRLPDGVEILATGLHRNKLRTGHLLANDFELTLSGYSGGIAAAEAIAERVGTEGIYNAYGLQRFGRNGDNLSRALAWARGEFRLRKGFQKKLIPSVLQSELFNRYLVKRAQIEGTLDGDVFRLANTGSHFISDDVAADGARLAEGDILLCGCLPGRRALRPMRAAAELLDECYGDLGVDREGRQRLEDSSPGALRDLLLVPERLAVHAGGDRLRLSFRIPAGSYATLVAREWAESSLADMRGGA